MRITLRKMRFVLIFSLFLTIALFLTMDMPGVAEAKTLLTITSTDITPDKAQQIALNKTDGGFVIKWGLDRENRKKVYEIEIINGTTRHSMDINAANGTISDYKTETSQRTLNIKPRLSAKQAQAAALKETGGGTVVKWELDDEKGHKVHEIKIIKGSAILKIKINDADGTIEKLAKKKRV